jgi:hypothetical protein
MNPNYLATLGAIVALILVGGGLYGCPQYQVYQQRLTGQKKVAFVNQALGPLSHLLEVLIPARIAFCNRSARIARPRAFFCGRRERGLRPHQTHQARASS